MSLLPAGELSISEGEGRGLSSPPPYIVTHLSFPQITTYAVDKFHAANHSEKCKCSPYNIEEIGKRIDGVNTSVSE